MVADLQLFHRAVEGAYAGLQIDGNRECAKRAIKGAALEFIGAEALVDLVADALGVDTGNLSTEQMREVCERLAVKLTHPDPETALRGPA
jgi:hypothetical protein